jgi:hypothetical protein
MGDKSLISGGGYGPVDRGIIHLLIGTGPSASGMTRGVIISNMP